MAKVSEAQLKASKKWDESHKEQKKYIVARSQAKRFIRKLATLNDLENLKKLIEIKENNMNKESIFATLSKKANLSAQEEDYALVWDDDYIDGRISDLINGKYKFGNKIVDFDEAKNYNSSLQNDLDELREEKAALLKHDFSKIPNCVAGDVINNKPYALVCTLWRK